MKVLHVYKTYLPTSMGGTERVIWHIAEGCAELGIDTTVLSLADDTRSASLGQHRGIYVKRDAKLASTDLSVAAFGRFAMAAKAVDIVHYHIPWPLADMLHFAAARRKPSVVTYHSDIVRQKRLKLLYAPLMHAFLRSVDRIVATSPAYLETSPVLAGYRHKTAVIPIGIGEREAYTSGELERLRARVGTGFFLFLGELRYYKGVTFLLEAARSSGLPVVIAGSGEMTDAIAHAGIENVKFLGRVSDSEKEALLELCGAFVFPSHLRSEAFGVALLEAARASRAMICCEIGTGTTYVNIHGLTGLTVPPADPRALAQVMGDLARDSDRRARMGAEARKRFEQMFTCRLMASAHRDLYEDVLRTAKR